MTDYLPQRTTKYKTYVKTATVEAFRDVFAHHKDSILATTKVGIDFPREQADYPTVIVRFFEREIFNAGVGHQELIDLFDPETGDALGTYKFRHYLYKGDIELAIYALSSYDRDLIADSLVSIITMGKLEGYSNRFFSRIYADTSTYPDAISHILSVNSDQVQGFGESQQQTPWLSEDDLIYQASYRFNVFGEFYSLPPDAPAALIERFAVYPYIEDFEAVPTGDINDGAEWE